MFSLTPWSKERGNAQALTTRAEHPLQRMRDEFDALFEQFLSPWSEAGENLPRWGLDFQDAGQEYVVRAEAPGFELQDFDVQLSGNQLLIRAERRQESKEGNDQSCSQRRLHRLVTVPSGVDPEKVEAVYRQGILELRLPKTPDALGQRIPVKS
jgi:HSP20 family protein